MEENNNTTPTITEESEKKTNKLLPFGLGLGLLILVVPILLSGKKKTNDNVPVTTEMITSPTAQVAAANTTQTVDVVNGAISVEAGSFYYKPNLIRVKKGEKVKLTLNSVSMMHDFNIDELRVKVPVTKSGSSSTVEFTASKVGEFEFYCSVGQHRQMGQVGKLIVVE